MSSKLCQGWWKCWNYSECQAQRLSRCDPHWLKFRGRNRVEEEAGLVPGIGSSSPDMTCGGSAGSWGFFTAVGSKIEWDLRTWQSNGPYSLRMCSGLGVHRSPGNVSPLLAPERRVCQQSHFPEQTHPQRGARSPEYHLGSSCSLAPAKLPAKSSLWGWCLAQDLGRTGRRAQHLTAKNVSSRLSPRPIPEPIW